MAIKILRSIQDGSEEEAPECDAENQVRHFRGFTGVILHEFSTKIHTQYRGATPIMLKGYMWSCPGRAA